MKVVMRKRSYTYARLNKLAYHGGERSIEVYSDNTVRLKLVVLPAATVCIHVCIGLIKIPRGALIFQRRAQECLIYTKDMRTNDI